MKRTMKSPSTNILATILFGLFAFGSASYAQDDESVADAFELQVALMTGSPLASAPVPAVGFARDESDEDADDDGDTEEAEDEEKYLAVVGGDVYTGNGDVLREATILAKDGKIEEIGYDLEIPEDAKVIDALGMRVYPGLVAYSSSGLIGGGSDFANTADPFNTRMILGLAGGITTTGQSSSVAKLKRFTLDGIVINEKPLVSFTWTVRSPASKRNLREKFEKATSYIRSYRQWQVDVKTDKELKEPSRRGVDLNVLRVLGGESRARFSADSRDDLLGIARFAQQYNFRPVIIGCYEGWTVASELGRAGVTAVITARTRRPRDERMSSDGGSSIENAAKLYEAGVQIAIQPRSNRVDLGGIVGRDIIHLPIEAGFAVRGGLPEDAALAAMTIVPARILGVDHRIGSLDVGKDCDLIVTDGDILHYETFTQYAVIDGRLVYDKQKELYYAHIRPRAERVLAPAEKLDPGEEETVEEEAEEGEGDDENEPEDDDDGDDGDDSGDDKDGEDD